MDAAVTVSIIGLLGAALGGVIAGCFSLLLQHAKHKDEQEDKELTETAEWRAHVDACLARDQKSIKELQGMANDTDERGKLTLQCLLAILGHMEDGNHTGELKKCRVAVERYLIER